jgi:Mn2+/Fe2+ NRAMP family transporter
MSSGIGIYTTGLLAYPILLGSIVVVIVTTILLITKGKRIYKSTKLFMIALIITALSIVVYSIVIAMAFGNAHPSATPVPLQ